MENGISNLIKGNLKKYETVCEYRHDTRLSMENYQQAVCPSGLAIQINDGEAYVSK